MRYPLKEGTKLPYGFPAGVKLDRNGCVIGVNESKFEVPKVEEKAEKVPEAVTKDRYSELKELSKAEQSEIIKKLGGKFIPSTEDERIKLIIKLE